jgi:hypothetical protein
MSRDTRAAVAATALVIVVVILGFRVLGSPANQRLVQADLRRVNALSQLAQQINRQWMTAGKTLPSNLDEFSSSLKQDPVSGKVFVYHAKSSDEYDLCATFATDESDARMHAAADRWIHPKGDFCFQFQASEQVPWVPYNY